ncbi:MAG: undecaprenyl diphosphate synthase family protein, partial [Desulfobulbaceae bacterium]|nr:undecaprenyl diphosphate synthase family protein [Desulfobulbaceae bacterium]
MTDNSGLDSDNIPRHVAIIMDGNGRWAKLRGKLRVVGHKIGSDTAKKIVRAANDLGVEILTLYAFSTENWKRPRVEVRALMT